MHFWISKIFTIWLDQCLASSWLSLLQLLRKAVAIQFGTRDALNIAIYAILWSPSIAHFANCIIMAVSFWGQEEQGKFNLCWWFEIFASMASHACLPTWSLKDVQSLWQWAGKGHAIKNTCPGSYYTCKAKASIPCRTFVLLEDSACSCRRPHIFSTYWSHIIKDLTRGLKGISW